jgi:galactoside O-acetyltransferase
VAFLTSEQITSLGLAEFGENVLISERASIYGAQRIRIGSNVRVDDFSILSAGTGGIEIGSHVHVAAYVSLMGAERITVGDFAGLSARVSIYSSSDDYSGRAMTGPTVPDRFRAVDSRPVNIGRHAIIGSGSVVLPGVTIGECVAIGALTLVRKDCEPFTIHSGNPARQIGQRRRDLLEREAEFRALLPR